MGLRYRQTGRAQALMQAQAVDASCETSGIVSGCDHRPSQANCWSPSAGRATGKNPPSRALACGVDRLCFAGDAATNWRSESAQVGIARYLKMNRL
jgi:hypothetical protein